MKVAQFTQYGPPEVFSIVEVPTPEPKANEILVKIAAVAATTGDARIRGARFPEGFGFLAKLAFGILKPRITILGNSFSGTVEKLGESVTNFKVGDEVCGMTGIKMGTYAQYVTVRSDKSVALKPKTISHDDAAAMLFGGTTALHFLRDKARVAKGDGVLVNGASGAVGTNALQIADYFGATVTAVTSGKNEKLVRSLGAKHVIDYTKQDVAEIDQKFDIVIETVGNITFAIGKKLLTPEGRLVIGVGKLSDMFSFDKQVMTATAPERKEDIEFLLSLMEQNKLHAIIEQTYPLEQIAKAHTKIDSGHKNGNIVLHP